MNDVPSQAAVVEPTPEVNVPSKAAVVEPTPELNSVPQAQVQAESLPVVPRPLSPYPNVSSFIFTSYIYRSSVKAKARLNTIISNYAAYKGVRVYIFITRITK